MHELVFKLVHGGMRQNGRLKDVLLLYLKIPLEDTVEWNGSFKSERTRVFVLLVIIAKKRKTWVDECVLIHMLLVTISIKYQKRSYFDH